MEKKKPHYSLGEIQRLVAVRKANAFTATALLGAAELGLSPDEAVSVVLVLRQIDFYKRAPLKIQSSPKCKAWEKFRGAAYS